MRLQRTLRRDITCRGIGLHGGRPVQLTLRPAGPDTGVVFRRSDLEGLEMPASVEDVCGVDHATTLSSGEAHVGTVEHVLSALAGLGVDNAVVEVDADEMPILDGSSAPFVYLIHEAGLRRQSSPRRTLRIRRPVEVDHGDRRVAVYPHERFKVTYEIDFDHPAIGNQRSTWTISPTVYQEEVAPARTFGFLRDVEAMRRAGLARGGSLDNAIVLGEHEVLNAPLRFADEFVRHKILDLIGDVALLGMPVLGHFVAHKAGHGLHAELVRAILADLPAHEVISTPVEEGASAALAPLSERALSMGRV